MNVYEEVDAAGIGEYLPDDMDVESPLEDDATKGEPERGEIEEVQVRKPSSESVQPEPGKFEDTGEGEDPSEGSGEDLNKGDGGIPPTGPGGKDENGEGKGVTPGEGAWKSPKRRPLPLERARVYCVDEQKGVYRLVVVSKEEASARIRLSFVGEEGREQESAPVGSVRLLESDASIPIDEKGMIGPIELKSKQRYILEVSLKESMRCALGVDADAN